MPEHREHTPADLRTLESFLWWDFDTAEPWLTWATTRGLDGAAALACYASALEIQGALRRLQETNNGQPPNPDAAAILNTAVALCGVRPHVNATGDSALVQARFGDPLGQVLIEVLSAMGRGVWRRFKICRDAECHASYFDASKNGAKTWCEMQTCGSRNKMRRYRARSV